MSDENLSWFNKFIQRHITGNQTSTWPRNKANWLRYFCVCFISLIVGVVTYALSSSVHHLDKKWKLGAMIIYVAFHLFIFLAIFLERESKNNQTIKLWLLRHAVYIVLELTTAYSFFNEKLEGKPDTYTLISSASFAIMSLCLSKLWPSDIELDILSFYCTLFTLQLMKLKWWFFFFGAVFNYVLIMLRFFLPDPYKDQSDPNNINPEDGPDNGPPPEQTALPPAVQPVTGFFNYLLIILRFCFPPEQTPVRRDSNDERLSLQMSTAAVQRDANHPHLNIQGGNGDENAFPIAVQNDEAETSTQANQNSKESEENAFDGTSESNNLDTTTFDFEQEDEPNDLDMSAGTALMGPRPHGSGNEAVRRRVPVREEQAQGSIEDEPVENIEGEKQKQF